MSGERNQQPQARGRDAVNNGAAFRQAGRPNGGKQGTQATQAAPKPADNKAKPVEPPTAPTTATTAPIETFDPETATEAAVEPAETPDPPSMAAHDTTGQPSTDASAATSVATRRRAVATTRPSLSMQDLNTAAHKLAANLRMYAGPQQISVLIKANKLLLRDDQRSTAANEIVLELCEWSVEHGWRQSIHIEAASSRRGNIKSRGKSIPATDSSLQINRLVLPAFHYAVTEMVRDRSAGAILDLQQAIIDAVWPGKSEAEITQDRMLVHPFVEEGDLMIHVKIPRDRALTLGAPKLANQLTALLTIARE
jgi:hypothetical protein